MAHFAELNEQNIVLRVLVINDNDCKDEEGKESESVGATYCNQLFGGRWIQTSYNNNIRKQYAGIGDRYDKVLDIFIKQQPYASWSLDSNYDWQPPTPYPSDGNGYVWDESNREWVSVG